MCLHAQDRYFLYIYFVSRLTSRIRCAHDIYKSGNSRGEGKDLGNWTMLVNLSAIWRFNRKVRIRHVTPSYRNNSDSIVFASLFLFNVVTYLIHGERSSRGYKKKRHHNNNNSREGIFSLIIQINFCLICMIIIILLLLFYI